MSRSQVWYALTVVAAGVVMWLAAARPDAELDAEDPVGALDEPVRPTPAPLPSSAPLAAAVPEPAQYAPEEPSPEPPAPPERTGPAPWPQGDILAVSKGPIDEYREMYGKQARDAVATEVENGIRQSFTHSSLPDLLHSASCHEGVCKLLIRWSPERAKEYIKAMRWLALGAPYPPGLPGFHSQIAFTSGSEADRDGMRFVELYLMRRPPEAVWMTKPHVREGAEGAAPSP
jgi:hypothetical protein